MMTESQLDESFFANYSEMKIFDEALMGLLWFVG